jgi:DNA-binding transcriptional ArsR family regulator
MTNNNHNPRFAPAAYQQHFNTEEFRFRWIDALVEVEDDWCIASVDHVARTLNSYMNESGECWPAVETLARAMRVDPRTVRRALSALVEHGWLISVSRPGNTNLFQAVLPEYGLELLQARRERRTNQSTTAEWQDATCRILDAACAAFGISRSDWSGSKDWARVEGRTRQIIQRLGGPALDTEFLIKTLTNEPPVDGVRDPAGFLLTRLSRVSRLVASASGKRRAARPTPTVDVSRLVEEVVSKQKARAAAMNDRDKQQGTGAKPVPWGDQ